MILKSDQEPAMIALQKEVRKELWKEVIEIMNQVKQTRDATEDQGNNPGGVVILENSPVGESQSNGSVEHAIKEVQQQIRKLKMQLEQNMAQKISNDSPIWPWIIQYAAQVIHTFKIHKGIGEGENGAVSQSATAMHSVLHAALCKCCASPRTCD